MTSMRRILLTAALFLLALATTAGAQELEVTAIDVGQGASVLLESEEGTVLFDAGRSGDTAYNYLRRRGIDEVDLIIASHAHADHVGGFPRILERMNVREIWYNGQTHGTQTFERFIDAALASGARYREPTRGQTRSFGALELEVLHPTTSAEGYTGHLHDKNIMVRATYGDFAVVLTGDAETDVERELIRAGLDLEATVLKMGHHGSRTSTSRAFANAVSPDIAFYQASATNQYGHPHDEAVSNARAAGATVMGTDEHGTIRFVTDGSTYRVMTERGAPTRGPPAAEEPSPEPDEPAPTGCVDVNSASTEQLQEIIHIGPARADQLVELRPFASVSGLTRVDGIGPSRVDDIQDEGVACVP